MYCSFRHLFKKKRKRKKRRVYFALANICLVPTQCCGEEKWGDWRPHLAMVLSNLTHTLDLDTRTITTMGDTLGRVLSRIQ